MNIPAYLSRLTHQAAAIARLVETVDADQARWKPTPADWSIVEVVNHLYDEEIEDFRIRLQLTLADPTQPWPPNDPVGNVTARAYNKRDLGASLENFLDERTVSLEWLRSLDNPQWQNTHEIPGRRSLSAGDLLTSWVAHDYAYQRDLAAPYSVGYAGDW
jgi:hypothetical protein